MSNSRKIFVAILAILTLAVTGIGIYIGVTLQQRDASVNDSSAAGFGNNADRKFFEPMYDRLSKVSCEQFINEKALKDAGITFDEYYVDQVYNVERTPQVCTYTLTTYTSADKSKYENKYIYANVFTYNNDSLIADSYLDLVNQISNLLLSNVISKDKYQFTKTYAMSNFFGETNREFLTDPYTCSSIYFHNWNDINYAYLKYTNFGNCRNLVDVNKKLSKYYTEKLNEAIINIYLDNGINNSNVDEYVRNLNIPISL